MNLRQPHVLPLGGTGEIGMNMTAYVYRRRWLVVDCGLTFHKDDRGHTEIHLPDAAALAGERGRIVGLVLTHAHLDHIGAVAQLWPSLRCPIYATPFTAFMLLPKLREAGLQGKVPLRILGMGSRVEVGPFSVEFIGVTHSTAECAALRIAMGDLRVVHTGDWKLDAHPGVGDATDEDRFRAIGAEGVDVVVGDSTNATREGKTGSESGAAAALKALISAHTGQVVATCFSSNLARIAALCSIASATGRQPVVAGASLHRTIAAARRAGYLRDTPPLLGLREAGYLPPSASLAIVTGSQGEPMAALSRMASGRHPRLEVSADCLVVFSSKIIPGNELPIATVKARLRERGCRIADELSHPEIHVSGHPARDDLRALYGWLKPRWVIPTHGEAEHLAAHAALADEMCSGGGFEIRNGDLVALEEQPRIVTRYEVGRLLRDASGGLTPVDWPEVSSSNARG